jgi:Domain of unknown function (DUF6702)
VILAWLLAAVLSLAPVAAPRGAAAGAAVVLRGHKLHVSYGSSAVEGNVVLLRLRFFRDDLENALKGDTHRQDFTLADDPATEAAFLAYLAERFTLTVSGERLDARILQSGEDELDREPVWWYAVQFEASAPVRSFRVRDTLLLELFGDQRNIVKFVHFPEQTQKTYAFARGEEEFEVRF